MTALTIEANRPVFEPDVTYDCREAFSDELIALAAADPRVVAVCNDSVGSSKLTALRDTFPERLVNVGIAEQDMVGVSAGLANAGLIPFVSGAAPFLTGRALEQIKTDAAYSNVRLILCGQAPGLAYGELGPTHHSIEDLSWTRAIANLHVAVPADRSETKAVMRWAVENAVPIYLRVPRFKVPDVMPVDHEFVPGRAHVLAAGNDATVIAIGTMVSRALMAAERLANRGIRVRVINACSVEPLDRDTILAAARETGAIVTAEEATTSGGLGAAVATLVSQEHPVPMRVLGIDRAFAPTGSTGFLLDHFGLNADGIVEAIEEVRRR